MAIHDLKHYRQLKEHCKECGLKVKEVPSKRLKDYAGENPAAAKAMGMRKIGKKEILIDKNMSTRTKLRTLRHETHEFHDMKDNKMPYWKAHVRALKAEKRKTRWEK